MPISAQEHCVRTGLYSSCKRVWLHPQTLEHPYSSRCMKDLKEDGLIMGHDAIAMVVCVIFGLLSWGYQKLVTRVESMSSFISTYRTTRQSLNQSCRKVGLVAMAKISLVLCVPFALLRSNFSSLTYSSWLCTDHLMRKSFSRLTQHSIIFLSYLFFMFVGFIIITADVLMRRRHRRQLTCEVVTIKGGSEAIVLQSEAQRVSAGRVCLTAVSISLILTAGIAVFILLMLSGDVETNPGPVTAPSLTVDNILHAVQGVEGLEDWLNVPRTVRDDIKKQYSTSTDRLAATLKFFLEADPYASWRSVIVALDRMKEHKIADEIREWAEPLSDPSLTVDNVTSVVLKVEKGLYATMHGSGDNLATSLRIPVSVQYNLQQQQQQQQQQQHDNKDAQTRAVIQYWIDTLSNASWSTLAGALYYMEEHAALDACKAFLQLEHDDSLSFDSLYVALDGVTSWNSLGFRLDVPQTIRHEIKSSYPTNPQRLDALVKHYLSRHPAPSWRGVARALYIMYRGKEENHQLLKKIYENKSIPDFRNPFSSDMKRAIASQGKLDKEMAHCIVVGPAGTGKSSMIRRFLGDTEKLPEFDLSTSTGSSEEPISVEIQKVSENPQLASISSKYQWRPLDKVVESAMLVLEAKKVDIEPKPKPKPIQPLVLTNLSQHTVNTHRRRNSAAPLQEQKLKSKEPTKVTTSSSSESPPLLTPPRMIARQNSIQKVLAMVRDDPDALLTAMECLTSISLYLTDTGGQFEFQELLPLLVFGPSVFLVLFRLDKGLDEPLHMKFRDPSNPNAYEYHSVITSKQVILQTLDTISEMHRDGSVRPPRVLLIGTYKDRLGDTEKQQVDKVKEIDKLILQLICKTTAYKRRYVIEQSRSQTVFAISNRLSSAGGIDPGLEEIKTKIIHDCVSKIGHPYNWFLFGIALRLEKQDILPLEMCQSLARDCGISSDAEMVSALSFLHRDVGLIRYFNKDSLKRFVFRTPQVLFNSVTAMILNTLPCAMNRVDAEHYRTMGIFKKDYLESIAMGGGEVDFLLALLKHLHIVGTYREDGELFYFMPCIVGHGTYDINKHKRSLTAETKYPPLIISFRPVSCPRGLFGALIVDLLDERNTKWSLNSRQIGKNHISFHFEASQGLDTVILKAGLAHIEVVYVSESDNYKASNEACQEIRKIILDTIDRVKRDPLPFKDITVSCTFNCPKCSQLDLLHFPKPVSIDDQGCPGKVFCEEHGNQEPPNNYKIWFKCDISDLSRENSVDLIFSSDMACDDLCVWLKQNKIPDKDIEKFRVQEVDGESLLTLPSDKAALSIELECTFTIGVWTKLKKLMASVKDPDSLNGASPLAIATTFDPRADTYLRAVNKAVFEARWQWREIGRALDLTEGTIRSIHKVDDSECLYDVLFEWVKCGQAKTSQLIEALEDKTVGRLDIVGEIKALTGKERADIGLD